MTAKQRRPLEGIRVLELGTMVAGPVAGTLLADFGAEVIKIEQPVSGDPIRHSGPFAEGESLYWVVEGRNKKSITLDLHLPKGQQVLRDLVRHADVVIENFRPGTMAKWGVGYEQLKAVNESLIMLSVSGYGQTGPYSERAAYDRVALAFSGFLNITGYSDRPPVRPGTAIADYQSALIGAFAVVLALYARDNKGQPGQHIDVALYESVLRFTDVMVTAYDKLGIERKRSGNYHFAASPGDHYQTVDGRYIALTVAADSVFRKLAKCMSRPELADDERFLTHSARAKNYDQINGIVADWIRSNPVEEICEVLTRGGVPHSLVYTVKDILADPHYLARESIVTVNHPKLGAVKMPGVFPRMSGMPNPPIQSAPELGEHTAEILHSWLGMTQSEVDGLRTEEVI